MSGQVSTRENNVWDVIASKTGQDRKVCKDVIYALLFGANIVTVMCHNLLEIGDVTEIRMAFDNYTKTWKTQR